MMKKRNKKYTKSQRNYHRYQKGVLTRAEKLIVELSKIKTKQAMSLCMWFRRRGELTPEQWGMAKSILGEEVL